MKHAKKSNLRRSLHFLMALCAAGLLCSAFLLLYEHWEYAQGDAAYRQLRRISGSAAVQTGAPAQPAGKAAAEEKQNQQGIDFLSLKKINPDVVAWITSAGTEIDYPVVRGKDNAYYLRHLFTGARNKLGSIFMDSRNHGDFSDRNTILYGHNMKDGSMFASLAKYKDQSYYDSFPALALNTPGGDFQIELFAGILVDGNQDSVRVDFKNDRDFQSYIDSLKKASAFRSNTVVKSNDRVLTLCTCSDAFQNARYALFGKLTPVP